MAVVMGVGLGLVLLAQPVTAKEHTASCPELGGMIGRVRASLEAAAGQRLRGSSLGAYQVLLSTVGSMVRDSAGQHCGALGPTLTLALHRAASSTTALDASIELDIGLDEALSLATEGHLPYASAPPKVPMVPPSSATAAPAPVGESALYAQDCPDLFKLTLKLEGPRQTLSDRVSGLLVDLGAHPRCQRVRRLLASASATHLRPCGRFGPTGRARRGGQRQRERPARALPRAAPGGREADLGHRGRRAPIQRWRPGRLPRDLPDGRASDNFRDRGRGAMPRREGPAGYRPGSCGERLVAKRGRLGHAPKLRRHPFRAHQPLTLTSPKLKHYVYPA